MFCTNCGVQIGGSNYCSNCGKAAQSNDDNTIQSSAYQPIKRKSNNIGCLLSVFLVLLLVVLPITMLFTGELDNLKSTEDNREKKAIGKVLLSKQAQLEYLHPGKRINLSPSETGLLLASSRSAVIAMTNALEVGDAYGMIDATKEAQHFLAQPAKGEDKIEILILSGEAPANIKTTIYELRVESGPQAGSIGWIAWFQLHKVVEEEIRQEVN